MKTNGKGFTLVELLVVIAIIGILSAVVLSSLNTARDKGANSAVKANLQGIRSQAATIEDDNSGDYTSVCSNSGITSAIDQALLVGGDQLVGATVATRCNSDTTAWAANALLKTPEDSGASVYWCVDSTGATKGEPTELTGATVCA